MKAQPGRSQERFDVGDDRSWALGFGDPAGVEPVRMHTKCPQTLQEEKAQGRNDPSRENANRLWTRTAEGNEAQKPIRSHADLSQVSQLARITRRKSIGTRVRTNRHVGPGDQK